MATLHYIDASHDDGEDLSVWLFAGTEAELLRLYEEWLEDAFEISRLDVVINRITPYPGLCREESGVLSWEEMPAIICRGAQPFNTTTTSRPRVLPID